MRDLFPGFIGLEGSKIKMSFLHDRSEDDTVQSETAQETNATEGGAESSQQQNEAPSTAAATEIDDAGLSMPQFDEVMAEQPTVVAETEPSAAQDMPDVGAVDQVSQDSRTFM